VSGPVDRQDEKRDAPEAIDAPIPRGEARARVAAAFSNLTSAILEIESIAMALARQLDRE
jgi:hypothetical protein